MVYRRSRTNVRRAPRRTYRRRSSYSRPAPAVRRRAPRALKSTRRAPRGPGACHCPGELTAAAKFVMAQIDPFDTLCHGAKIPDSNTFPSIANTDTELVAMSAPGAAGNLSAIALRPQWTHSYVRPISAATLNWGANWDERAVNRARRSAYNSAMELSRPVAHACRITSPLSPTTASGFVHIALSSEHNYTALTWQYPTTIEQMSGLQYYKRVTLSSLTQTPLTIINKWLDDTAFRYIAANNGGGAGSSANEINTDYGWASIVIIVEGAPANESPLSIEHILLTEGVPDKSGVIIGTPAAQNSPGAMQAVGNVNSKLEPFHTEAGQTGYIEQGVRLVAEGAVQAGTAVYNEIAQPLLTRIGHSLGNTAVNYAINAVMGLGGIPGVNANPNRLALTG